MKESTNNSKVLKVMFGVFLIGGAASLYKLFHSKKPTLMSYDYTIKEDDSLFFFI